MTGKIKVFLVEDDDICAFLVENRLCRIPNLDLSVFPLGQDCIDQLDQGPDVIFLDYSLPATDGLEVLKQIKEVQPQSRVVMLSGLDWDQVMEQCREAGAEDFILKDAAMVQKVIDKLITMFPVLNG